MDNFNCNINFKSNLFLVSPDMSNPDMPYNDIEFLSQIYDPIKIEQIQKYHSLTEKQNYILEKAAVCVYAKRISKNEKAQYFVFQRKGSQIVDVCKCRLKECPLINKCRPNENEDIDREEQIFSKLKPAVHVDQSKYYPVLDSFNRVIERHNDAAFSLLANTDLQRYIDEKYKKITFAYNGLGNGGSWDNWDGGDLNNYFDAYKTKQQMPIVEIKTNTEVVPNPLLEYQKSHPKNLNNPFFKNISNKK